MSRRTRALAFALLALASALASAALAARATESGPPQGELRAVVVVSEPLAAGEKLKAAVLRRALETREVPAAFLPPDAIYDPAQVEGAPVRVDVPAGSYLLAGHLGRPERSRPAGIPRGFVPIDVEVAAAGAIGRSRRARQVDVVVARESSARGSTGVSVVARRARLLALEPARNRISGDGPRWLATLALLRADAIAVIEAENFAREVRLLPR